MTSEFSPKFPRSISGGDFRTPLDHPEIETIAKRLDHLYRNFGLSESHRAEMLVRYANLVRADEAIENLIALIAEFSRDMPLPLGDPGIRPKKPTLVVGSGNTAAQMAVGFVLRLGEWVQRLEDIYGVTAWKRLGELANHDAPSPGDDI